MTKVLYVEDHEAQRDIMVNRYFFPIDFTSPTVIVINSAYLIIRGWDKPKLAEYGSIRFPQKVLNIVTASSRSKTDTSGPWLS